MQIVALVFIVIFFLFGFVMIGARRNYSEFVGVGLWFTASLLIIGIMISEAIKHRKE